MSQQVGLGVIWPIDFSKVASGVSLMFLPHAPRSPLKAGLGGKLHTQQPPSAGVSMLCQGLAEILRFGVGTG